MSRTSVIQIEIDGTFWNHFAHADASFTNFSLGNVFFIGSEGADTVSATSEPIKKTFEVGERSIRVPKNASRGSVDFNFNDTCSTHNFFVCHFIS